jgi:hypothetical protein
MKKQFVCLLFILFVSIINVFGWGGRTHQLLTHYSWLNSKKLADMTFLLKLNLDKGMLNEKLSDGNAVKNPDEWLQYGAEHEDDSYYPLIPDRSNFHFHNPLKEWSEAGLSDTHVGASGSSIWWAQNSALQAFISKDEKKARTWYVAREYLYKGLIEFADMEKRNTYFAELFKTLGNQVHLIQDLAVPDHVRNDSHVLNSFPFDFDKNHFNSFRCIEGWADYNVYKGGKIEGIALGAAQTPLISFSTPADPECPVPIAWLSDTKQYKINQTPSAGLDQGLAEYTNANFFSEDTIFTEEYEHDHKHWFPHPAKSETNVMSLGMPSEVTAEDGRKDWIKPVNKKNGGENLNNLVFAGYYEHHVDEEKPEYKFTFFLSDLCHEEYASKLIPRAVGYSAALIDYFFRGEIEISLPVSNPGIDPPQKEGIYSLCTDPVVGFDKLSLMVRNITANNEEMKNGKITLVISYRTCNGNPFVPNPPLPSEERKFIEVDYQGEVTIPRDNPLRINFDLSEHPLPFDAVDVTLTVVFKGDLGAELTNAVAIGFKDISEPTPVDLYNNTDWVCYNGIYVDYNNPDLIQQVDTNHNGVIDCGLNEINIIPSKITPQFLSFNNKTASATNYYYQFPIENPIVILPGQSHRFYFLADDNPAITRYSVKVKAENIDNSSIPSAGVCYSYYNNDVSDANSYYNKLQWIPVQNKYNNPHAGIGSYRGIYYYNFVYFENVSVPENSECSLGSSGSTQTVSDSTENRDPNKVYGQKIVHKAKSRK